MRKPAAAVLSVAWGAALGGTFGCLLPYLLNEWHFHRPLPYWTVAQAACGLFICAGLVPIVQSFTEFTKAGGTPVPVASPPRLVVTGFYRYVRNPIYVRLPDHSDRPGAAVRLARPPGVHHSGLVYWRSRRPLL